MKLLDGKKLQDIIKKELKEEILKIIERTNKHPQLAIIQVGDNQASNTYIKQKLKHSSDIGIKSIHIKLDENTLEGKVIQTIKELNNDNSINGIIVQLPLPKHLNEFNILEAINPLKDIDCLTSANIGLLHMQTPYMTPCTPSGIIEMLERYNIEIKGKNILIIGRSNIVGRPVAEMLTQLNATVTLAHSNTEGLIESLTGYDIIISTIGKAHFIKAEHLRMDNFFYTKMKEVCVEQNKIFQDVIKKIVIVDVGMNRDEQGSLCGDVDYKAILNDELSFVSHITPTPNGTGRLTVSMLLKNVVKAFKIQNNIM